MFPAKKTSSKFLPQKTNSKGQGIIELIVVLGLAAILILALVTLATRSNRGTTFSSASDQAARLSQEGMEKIHDVKLRNADAGSNGTIQVGDPVIDGGPVCFPLDGPSFTWTDFFNINVPDENPDPSCGRYGMKGFLHDIQALCPVTAPDCLHFTDDNAWSVKHLQPPCVGCPDLTIGKRVFQRYIYVADTPANLGGKSICNSNNAADLVNYGKDWKEIKQFSVEVTWTDSAGLHSKVTTECLTKDT
ncbi:MAG TPA: hypothetical protein VLE47_04635 [Candidatus Saccharimonadales bacterium]|nr:hypothetical protein [Candidatus Saccharimonadales bacterium]